MATSNSQFYVVGGTVNPDSPSYVVRRADQELYDRLLAGEFCYVLTSRQMGKSSLMARTARRLTTEAHIHAAIVDLTQIGTERDKLSAEQWYYGIAHRILREVGLRDVNLSEWWQSRSQLPALQRLTDFFRDLLLEQITGQIVIFIDEIDSTISLPFTDDFFAAIRACHNARATDAAYNRLSFVLLGVASPSDLVKDATRTPFNIGQRIELTDFTVEEAAPLVAGLSANPATGEQILTRILDWTGGHPYLTQRLCEEVRPLIGDEIALKGATLIGFVIDSLVKKIFFSLAAMYEDPNLCFVRDWLTTRSNQINQSAIVDILTIYIRVLTNESVIDNPLSSMQARLKLSGLVKLTEDRTLRVRNLIYEYVFSSSWAAKAISQKTYEENVQDLWLTALVSFVCLGISFYQTTLGYRSLFGSLVISLFFSLTIVLLLFLLIWRLRIARKLGQSIGTIISIFMAYLIFTFASFAGNFNSFYTNFMKDELLKNELLQKRDKLGKLREEARNVLTLPSNFVSRVSALSIDLENQILDPSQPGCGEKCEKILLQLELLTGEFTRLGNNQIRVPLWQRKRLVDDYKRMIAQRVDTIIREFNSDERQALLVRIETDVSFSERQIEKALENPSQLAAAAIAKSVEKYKELAVKIESQVGEEKFAYDKEIKFENDNIGKVSFAFASARKNLGNWGTWIAAIISVMIDLFVPIVVFLFTTKANSNYWKTQPGLQRL